ncbi:uncharacterized protein LOC131952948 [Physella acuta]|uniref:uncharacterized protein LOC131952948 n=1 Tax=Physella acuta TaxID=109671 RepID=UPI0027DC125F|nr:uncharacterized protein LOC131952948 [Physella acuta]
MAKDTTSKCKAFNRLLGAYQNVSGITTLKDCFTSCVTNASCIAYYYNILPDCRNYILNTTISNPAQSGVVSYNICPNDPSQCLSSTKLTANIVTVSANKTCYQTCLENPICVGSYSVNGKCRNDYLNGTLINVLNDSKVEAFVRCRMMNAPTTTTTITTVETTTTTSTTSPTTTTTTEETTTTEPTTFFTTTDEKTTTAAPTSLTNTPEPCTEKADIIVLLDASTSIGAESWSYVTQTAANITQYFDVGPDKVRFAAMTFNRKPTAQFNLKDHLDHDSLTRV